MNFYDILYARKMAGGQGEITTEGLSVTENGTYTAPEGKAYTPVVVNVPTPDDSYQLKSLPIGAISTITDGSNLPMPSLKVGIEPIQEGSGDPSPTNIRPISGWDECKVTVADDVENPTVSNTYTIDLDGTRYGGTLDVVSGVLTVKMEYIADLGSLTWSKYGTYSDMDRYITTAIDSTAKTNTTNAICSIYPYRFSANGFAIGSGNSKLSIFTEKDQYASVAEFKSAMSGAQLVYELATPLTIQLTPTQVKSLLGTNNIWADTGNILEGEYFKAL